MGNQTLSIVEDGDLFITRAIRGESGTHAKICSCLEWMHYVDSHMPDLIVGFTRYLWNLLAISGLVLTILASETHP